METPYPVSHGGLFDLFYKLPALHREGISIILHCFTSRDEEQPELNRYCKEVYYYRRAKGFVSFSLSEPYIVSSRRNTTLTERLAKDDHPILLEGIHCTAMLDNRRFLNRKIILRLHNVEFRYYRQLFHNSHSFFKKIYYLTESILLKRYESDIAKKVSLIAAVSEQDAIVYKDLFRADNIAVLPVFGGFDTVHAQEGSGSYCLYHGDLSVAENESAAVWLIGDVFNDLSIPVVIAGKDPSEKLMRVARLYPRISVVANPSSSEMENLIMNAQLHVLPSFSRTGIKLKLLHALYNGRHCLVNDLAVEGTGLAGLCAIEVEARAFKSAIQQYYHKPFTADDVQLRQKTLTAIFDTQKNIRQLIRWIW